MPRREGKIAPKEKFFGLVLEATSAVMEILEANGISCAVFGSLASKLYGTSRDPQDIDLLVFQDPNKPDTQILSTEELKQLIYRTRPGDFYLKNPRDQEATFKILIYRPSPTALRPARTQKQIIRIPDPECKVDILVPGTMHLPHIRPELIQWHAIAAEEGLRLKARVAPAIPLVPFALLLSDEEHKRQRQHKDAKDVKRLLQLTSEVGGLKERGAGFQQLTAQRVRDFARAFPGSAITWIDLGFDVSS
ncbi:hypothetical protein BJ912DRAFT_964130 [Pholiota molesta]|nr:hypothetical protein BJ912DRAFT_964130 [Pholiota molesta]